MHSGETYLVMKIDEIVCVCVNWMCESEAKAKRETDVYVDYRSREQPHK